MAHLLSTLVRLRHLENCKSVFSFEAIWATGTEFALTLKYVIGVGAVLTAPSLFRLWHIAQVGYEVYQRGYPLAWLVLPTGLVEARGRFPTWFFIYDLLFWFSIVFAAMLLGMRVTGCHRGL